MRTTDNFSTSQFTTFTLPLPYSSRVQSALVASPVSVKLSNLVGGNGWWYRWGKKLADMLEDEQATNIRNMLLRASTKDFRCKRSN